MESIFTRLQSYRPRANKTPEEDFFTEAFVGVMERYPELLSYLLSQILSKPNTPPISFDKNKVSIQSQCSFSSPNGLDRPDIVIKGSDIKGNEFIFFIENKIGSTEGFNQLSRYAKQLVDRFPDFNKYLLYITKYSEHKDESEIMDGIEDKVKPIFIQTVWHEIYSIINSYPSKDNKPLITELLKFMEDKKMNLQLGFADLATTVKHKRIENNYKEILNAAWDKSKIANLKFISGKKWSSFQNTDVEMSFYSPPFTQNEFQIYFGFWLGDINHFSAFKNSFQHSSNELPSLFVSIATDKNRVAAISELQKLEGILKLVSQGWKYGDNNSNEWVLISKAVNLTDIHMEDNLADFFIRKFTEELDNLNSALKDVI